MHCTRKSQSNESEIMSQDSDLNVDQHEVSFEKKRERARSRSPGITQTLLTTAETLTRPPYATLKVHNGREREHRWCPISLRRGTSCMNIASQHYEIRLGPRRCESDVHECPQ